MDITIPGLVVQKLKKEKKRNLENLISLSKSHTISDGRTSRFKFKLEREERDTKIIPCLLFLPSSFKERLDGRWVLPQKEELNAINIHLEVENPGRIALSWGHLLWTY